MALNASQDAMVRESPGKRLADQAPTRARRRWFASKAQGELRIYQHSNLLYWWPIWAYGFLCAVLTYVQGIGVRELAATTDKVVLFHPSPWLGISFIALILFVAVFTNVRARGVYSFMLILIAGGLLWLALKIPGVDTAFGWLSLLRVHLTWWRFSPGQVIEEHRIGQATGHAYNTEGMVVRRLPDDLFRHRLLGLGLFGWGTGDFIVKPPYEDPFEIHNVFKAGRKQRHMEQMIATRMTESVQAKT